LTFVHNLGSERVGPTVGASKTPLDNLWSWEARRVVADYEIATAFAHLFGKRHWLDKIISTDMAVADQKARTRDAHGHALQSSERALTYVLGHRRLLLLICFAGAGTLSWHLARTSIGT
jgi:hypothetical protein